MCNEARKTESPCFVYSLLFPSGLQYIGISVDPSRRWHTHLANARVYNKKAPMYSAIRKHGAEAVKRTILLCGSVEYCKMMEVILIREWDTRHPNGYNLTPGGDYSPTVIPEVAAKQAASLRGRKLSEKTRAKMSASAKGRVFDEVRRKNMSEAGKVRGARQSFFHWSALSVRLAFAECKTDNRPMSIIDESRSV